VNEDLSDPPLAQSLALIETCLLAGSQHDVEASSQALLNSLCVCLRREKCDPTAIWKLADKYLSSFNDISMLMYRQEFQRRLDPFLS